MKALWIDACVTTDRPSRTRRLAEAYLAGCRADGYEIDEVHLEALALLPLDGAALEKREQLLREGVREDESFFLARAFQAADLIVVAAPYWDLSFPSQLKIYIEHIMVSGITFRYTERGAMGLCRARRLVYITTSGGFIGPQDHGYSYIRDVCRMLGVEESISYSAQGLDIDGCDVEAELRRTLEKF